MPFDLYTIDRSKLDLPATQECDRCHRDLPNIDFDFQNRNQYTKDEPYRLKTSCKACLVDHKKGLMMRGLKSNEKVISDALIAELTANGAHDLQRVVRTLIEAVLADPTSDMLRLLINTAQGSNPVVHMKSENEDEEQPLPLRPPGDGAKNLLQSLKIKKE